MKSCTIYLCPSTVVYRVLCVQACVVGSVEVAVVIEGVVVVGVVDLVEVVVGALTEAEDAEHRILTGN